MSDIAVKIENLYKEYHLGVIGHGTLYRDLQSWWALMRGKEDPNSIIGKQNTKKEFANLLALKNISLEIKKGEILGVIGTNGAGKSTLLKILSRVTTPTKGTVKIKGRIASLLEVGTGFHTELTGKENIYLNGSINGMSRLEIDKRIDEIIEFAGIEKFIDTPVKRYSSGMYVRLGFAVAAHMDPDILVVDEVLAVGDLEFQKKAIGKMKEVSSDGGRTVLFVSHNMSSISNLCSTAILLNEGCIVGNGPAKEIVKQYMGGGDNNLVAEKTWIKASKTNKPKGVMFGKELARIKSVRIVDDFNNLASEFNLSDNIYIKIEYEFFRKAKNFDLSFYINNDRGQLVCVLQDHIIYEKKGVRGPGHYTGICKISKEFLNDGQYFVTVLIQQETIVHIRERDVVSFIVKENMDENGVRGYYRPLKSWPKSAVRIKSNWETIKH